MSQRLKIGQQWKYKRLSQVLTIHDILATKVVLISTGDTLFFLDYEQFYLTFEEVNSSNDK